VNERVNFVLLAILLSLLKNDVLRKAHLEVCGASGLEMELISGHSDDGKYFMPSFEVVPKSNQKGSEPLFEPFLIVPADPTVNSIKYEDAGLSSTD
jgi:hypothetical protein